MGRPTEDAGTGGRFGFGHVPALDGLRGLAVAGVLAYHLGHLRGGYLGVDLFFVLSGYLITSLLLAERGATGGVALGSFWVRRVRRLLPALLLLLVGVAAYAEWVARRVDLATIRADSLAALAYVANWHTILRGSSYWDISLAPSPLQHVWSLAIEEQFYLVWPLAFSWLAAREVARRRSTARLVLRVGVGGAIASTVLFVGLHALGASDTRVYEGTDTRATALLLGVALAGWWRLRRRHEADTGEAPVGLGLERVGVGAAVLLALLWFTLDGRSAWLYRGGLPLASLLATLVVAAAADARSPWLGRALSVPPLRALGVISYGLYLWHWPVFLALDLRNGRYPGFGDARLGDAWLLVAKLALSLLLAVASYVLVERPIRRRAILRGPVGASTAVGAMALAGLLVVTATAGVAKVPRPDAPVGQATVKVARAPRVVFVGDSVAMSVVRPVVANPRRYGINPVNRTYPGCSVISQGRATRSFAGTDVSPAPCYRNLGTDLPSVRADAVFLLIGARPNDAVQLDGEWRRACDPVYDRTYVEELRRFVRRLRSTGAEVVLGTVARSGREAIPVAGSEARIACLNQTVRRVASGAPHVTVVDLNELVCPGSGRCREELDGHAIRTDGLHFDPGPGGAAVADWVVDRILEAAHLQRQTS